MALPIPPAVLKWLLVLLQPQIEALVKEIANIVGGKLKNMVARAKDRAAHTQEKADEANALANRAKDSDPIEAARQRGRQEAYDEMAKALDIDAKDLESIRTSLHRELADKEQQFTERLRLAAKKSDRTDE